jgi:hypothetical protein
MRLSYNKGGRGATICPGAEECIPAMKMFPHPAPETPPAIPLVDNPFAPEILSTGIAGFSIINGVITLTLENVRCDHSRAQPELERVVIARLAMSVPGAQAFLTGLYQFLSQHGVNPLHAEGAATCQ